MDEPAMQLDFEAHLAAIAGPDIGAIRAATADAIGSLGEHDYDALARHSPGLKGWDWLPYLRLSSLRIAHAAALLRGRGIDGGRLLDYGAYFGNFALFARHAGFESWAFDGYQAYEGAFAPHQ